MENLKIEATKSTFGINFNAENGEFLMEGSSYPENAVEFFQPLYDYLRQYISEVGQPLIVNLKIVYLNTSSSKCILDFLEILNDYHDSQGQVKVNWYYEEDDEDILETGEDLCENLNLPYKFIVLP